MAEYKMVWPVLIAFAISVILGPFVIPYLRKLKMGQTERVDGVQSHLKKAGTPRRDFSLINSYHIFILYKRLSKDYSGFIFDTGIWNYWIFR